jgi:hypothetical protein
MMMIDRNLEIKEELEELEGWVMWECPEDDDDDDDGGLEAKDEGFREFYPPSVDLGVNETDGEFDIIKQDEWWNEEDVLRNGISKEVDVRELDYTIYVVNEDDWDEED